MTREEARIERQAMMEEEAWVYRTLCQIRALHRLFESSGSLTQAQSQAILFAIHLIEQKAGVAAKPTADPSGLLPYPDRSPLR
jgi:hypothetical protein